MENLVEEKYYDLILNLVRQHRRYESCKTIENDIVDDVLKRLQPVLKDIHDEAIIESYLQKLVSNSIITMSHKNNIPRRNISKPALFDNIVNQEKPVEVTQKQAWLTLKSLKMTYSTLTKFLSRFNQHILSLVKLTPLPQSPSYAFS